MDPLVICAAPVPGEKQEEKFPGELDVAGELIRCHSAGAAIGHLHVRGDDLLQTTDLSVFRRDIDRIHDHCSLIIEGSTGGAPEHTLEERSVSFNLASVEMGSLNLGSVNMFGGVYSNPWNDIRFYARKLKEKRILPVLVCFDLSHFAYVERLLDEGLIAPPCVFEFVFDVPDALPFRENYLDYFLNEIPKSSHWFLARHHARGAGDYLAALERGGHVRVGFEDGPFLSEGRRAASNAELVEDIAALAEKTGRSPITPEEAREHFQLNRFKA